MIGLYKSELIYDRIPILKVLIIKEKIVTELKGSQKKYLRGLAHKLNPSAFIGHKGITENLIEEKDRIPTKIPRAVVRKRLTNKRKTSEKKAKRKPPEID